MSLSLLNGASICLRCSIRQSLGWSANGKQRRAIGSINSAIHKGLHRDNGKRQGRAKPDAKGVIGWEERGEERSRRRRTEKFRQRQDSSPAPRPGEWAARETQDAYSRDIRQPVGRPVRALRRDEDTLQEVHHASPSRSTSYPLSVPHTTATSQFLYGYSSVYAALIAKRRQFHKLYIHPRSDARSPNDHSHEESELRRLAKKTNVQIIRDPNVKLLDKMSDGRSHNGVVLEASPLPIPSIASLTFSNSKKSFATVSSSGKSSNLHKALNPRPTLLLLDDIHDPGNLGAILRSAYFLGIDAVILTEHVAPLNAVALKASSGAAEAMTIFRVADPGEMLRKGREEGWSVVAATTPGQVGKDEPLGKGKGAAGKPLREVKKGPGGRARWEVMEQIDDEVKGVKYHFPKPSSTLQSQGQWNIPSVKADLPSLFGNPTILVVGGEGRGLRRFITRYASAFLEILSPREQAAKDVGVDSLNVSVSVGVAVMEVLGRVRNTAGLVDSENGSERKEKNVEDEIVEDRDRLFDLGPVEEYAGPVTAEDSVTRSTGSLQTLVYR